MSSAKWFVRGVPAEVTEAATAAAKARGVTVGRIVTAALQAHLARLAGENGEETAASNRSAEIERRLGALESALGQLLRERPSGQQTPTERDGSRKSNNQPPLPDGPLPAAPSGPRKSKQLTARIPAFLHKALDSITRSTEVTQKVLVQ
jgi:hypothetical protein